jgi:hypothetical protein
MWHQIEEKSKKLDKAIQELATNGYDLAEKEKKYKTAVSQKALELRANDTPVTLINQIIYGYKEIADLRFDRDVAEVKYNANLEYINVIKLQIRILENQIAREWGNSK